MNLVRKSVRRVSAGIVACGLTLAAAHQASANEVPSLNQLVEAGLLPAMAERLPESPAIEDFRFDWQDIGAHGGQATLLMSRAKDIRIMTVYGYARLVGYTPDFDLQPDILRRVDVEDNKVFTFHLRPGHRWSDGHPFTAEDFRFWWEDVANNDALNPAGPPDVLLPEGRRPQVRIIDPFTVQYAWTVPNPAFLPALAGASPLYIYTPAHYLRQFHENYQASERLAQLVEESNRRNWAAMFNRLDNAYKNDNVMLPTLDPWVVATKAPSERFVFRRNPFYHRVDYEGRQLPYLDEIVLAIADGKIIPAKTGAGESDLQARYVRFDNYTFLKEGEKRNPNTVTLWRTAPGAHLALYPNLNAKDDQWRTLFRDVTFRRALSLAVNRRELNQVIYYGLAIPGNNTVLPASPLYRDVYREKWAEFDLVAANRMLDELGLTERDDRGVRLLPDGRPMDLIIETAGESTETTDVLELVHDSYLQLGIKVYTKPTQREVFRNRIFSGATLMAISKGIENGIITPNSLPDEMAPHLQTQYQWPKWGQYRQTKGTAGEPPDLPEAQELERLYQVWREARTKAEKTEVWHKILALWTDQVFTIGLIAGVLQPVVAHEQLRNLPKEGVYNWDPGAHFGIYRPDGFWFDGNRREQISFNLDAYPQLMARATAATE